VELLLSAGVDLLGEALVVGVVTPAGRRHSSVHRSKKQGAPLVTPTNGLRITGIFPVV
jgi:hypothetical protein